MHHAIAAILLVCSGLLVAYGAAGLLRWRASQRHAAILREIDQAGIVFAAYTETRGARHG